ncbi:hypothetical protein ACUXV3_05605 [Roseobacteraceae bacterium NS-SX3]
MFTRITGAEAFFQCAPTMFEGASWFSPFIETMTSAKLPWAQTPAVHSCEAMPSMEEFQRLLQAYAESRQDRRAFAGSAPCEMPQHAAIAVLRKVV